MDGKKLTNKPNIVGPVSDLEAQDITPIELGHKLKEKEIRKSELSRKKVILNARGMKYDVLLRLFDKYPKSRLGKLKILIDENRMKDLDDLLELCDDYDTKLNEFYFDCDPDVLKLIIGFYKNDRLHYPTNICANQFEDELKYWQISEYKLDDCCQLGYFKCKESIDEDNKNRVLC